MQFISYFSDSFSLYEVMRNKIFRKKNVFFYSEDSLQWSSKINFSLDHYEVLFKNCRPTRSWHSQIHTHTHTACFDLKYKIIGKRNKCLKCLQLKVLHLQSAETWKFRLCRRQKIGRLVESWVSTTRNFRFESGKLDGK